MGLNPALMVISGIIISLGQGAYFIGLVYPNLPLIFKLFFGGILTVSSLSIAIRIFKDCRQIKSKEAKITISASVVEGILGLIVLSLEER